MSAAGDLDPAGSSQPDEGRRRRWWLSLPGLTRPTGRQSAAPSVDRAELDRNRDAASAAALPLLSAALGLMLLLSAFFRLHPLESVTGMVAAAVAGVTGVALMITAGVLSRRTDLAQSAHAVAAAVLLVSAVSLCVAMVAVGSLNQTAYIELLIVASGAVLMKSSWFAAVLAALWALWLGVAAMLSGTLDPAGWLLAMLGATVISIVVHTMRTDAIRELGGALIAAEAEAVRDPLSGLLNRRGLEVVGQEVLALAKRSREPLSCTFIDVDGLKEVNDAFGHDSGDSVIRAVSDALSGVFREADVVARWGGDEFIVIALGSGPRVEEVERRLSDHLGGSELAASGKWAATVSAGRIVHMPWQDETLQEITDRADQEMYRRRRLRRAKAGDHGSDW
jgi:diguanylate cyclase (GGDEF)-like protein